MILTCYACPRQIAFPGQGGVRDRYAGLFGWRIRDGRYFCTAHQPAESRKHDRMAGKFARSSAVRSAASASVGAD